MGFSTGKKLLVTKRNMRSGSGALSTWGTNLITPFKFPPLFRKPKNVEIPKRLGVRAVVVDSSNNFLLKLQDILNPDLSLTFGKIQLIK